MIADMGVYCLWDLALEALHGIWKRAISGISIAWSIEGVGACIVILA
jgi:hypothetical protein